MTHELKSWREGFEPVWRGEKTAEFRHDDRCFMEGDTLLLREWVPKACEYTGREIMVIVTHVQRGFGIPETHAMLSIRVLSLRDAPSGGPSAR